MARRILIQPKQSSQGASPIRPIRDVQVLDASRQKRIYDEALSECQAALEELESLKGEWAGYQEQDQPAYASWLHATFGPLLSEIRECFEKIGEKRAIIEAVERISREYGCDYGEAYAILLEEEEKAKRREPEEEEAQPEFDFSSKRESERGFGGESGSEASERADHGKSRTPELKGLYRALARQLHPDVSDLDPSLKARASQLWHQVQEAYQEGDLERLTALSSMAAALVGNGGGADGSASGMFGQVSVRVSDILASARRYRRAARTLRRDLDYARRTDPAFGFHLERKRSAGMKKRARIELELELEEAQTALASLEQFIEQWEEEALVWERRERKGRQGRGRGKSRRR